MDEQLLTTFNHAAEEMRALRDHEWMVTNYVVLALGALVAVPWVVKRRHTLFCALAVLLVLLVAYQGLRTLWFTGHLHDVARDQLREAVESLPDVCKIHREHAPMLPEQRPRWVRWLSFWSNEDPPDLRCETRPTSALRAGADQEPEDRGVGAPGAGEASKVIRGSPLRPGLVAVVIVSAALVSLIIVSHIRGVMPKAFVVAVLWVVAVLMLNEVSAPSLS